MGSIVAADFAEMVDHGMITLEEALRYHLSGNHYPPIPMIMLPVCLEAIKHADLKDYEHMIPLPDKVSFKGMKEVAVSQVIDDFHLSYFIGLDQHKPEVIK